MSTFKPTEFNTGINVTTTHPLKEVSWLLGSILAIIIGVYLFLVLLLFIMVPRISIETELKIWDKLHFSALFEEETSKKNIKRQKYIQTLVDTLPTEAKPEGYDFKIHVVDDKEINAYALPGGNIGITTGLLDNIGNENALIYVIGHELGHFEGRHHLKSLGLVAGTTLMSLVLVGASDSAQSFISSFISFTDLANSRQAEHSADEWALKTLNLHYGHVGGASDFFILADSTSLINIPEMLSTHPSDENRINNIKTIIKDKRYIEKQTKQLPWEKIKKSVQE